MSDQNGSENLVALYIEGPNPASELAIYDHTLKLRESGIGRIEARLPSGLYDLEASIANRRERKTVALHSPMTIGAGEWDLKARTAAPLSGALPARDVHEEKAKVYSHVPTMAAVAHAGDCRLFIFLRTVKRDATGELQKPEQRFWSGFKLSAGQGDLVCEFADRNVASELENGWCALTVDLAGGGYILSGPDSGGNDICIPLWLQARFETQLFVPVEDGHPLFDEITLTMAPKNEGFDPARQSQTEFAAALLAGFRRGENPVNPELVRGMLKSKLCDPFAGIVAAHGLLRMTQPDQELFLDILTALRELLGDHPDVVALEWMSPQPVSSRVLTFPPTLRLSFDGVLSRSASNSQIIEVNSLISDVLGTLLAGQYVLWRREATRSKIIGWVKGAFWGVLAIAPGLLKFKGDDSRRVKVDLDATLSTFENWLQSLDRDKLAAQLSLPRTIIDRATSLLIELLPGAHQIAKELLKDIELPASLGDPNSMTEAFLSHFFRTAAVAAKLSPLDRRVIQLIIQCWKVFGERNERAREAAQCQRRLIVLANTASKARDLLPPNFPEHADALIIIAILSGLAARLYPFLLIGHELEVIVEAGWFAAVTGAKGKFLGPASTTAFGSTFEEILKKNLRGTWLSSARAEDFTPITIRDGLAMDFMRVYENYWTAGIDMTGSKLAKNPTTASPNPDVIDRHYVNLAKTMDQDCAKLLDLVRDALDPLTPTRQALETLPAEIKSLNKKLHQRISDDTAAD